MTGRFRAWDGKKWHYEGIFLSHDGILWHRPKGKREMVKVDWEVSHYTGVTDSDGSVIYTGDFVKGEVEGLLGMQEVQGVVYYEMGNCILDCGNVIVTLASLVEFDEELYVLGNKFENPDMLDN